MDETKLRSRHRNAYIALYIIGGLTLLLGLFAELGHVDVLLKLFGSGWFAAAEGIILIALGYFTMRGSLIALGIATGLYGIETVVVLLAGAFAGIWLRLLILFFLVQGFMALRELKGRQRVAASPVSPTSSPAPTDPSLPRQDSPTTS
ncbi:MAG: hypothetical protein M3Z28_10690 [Candidatus Dormibacteraeota bacterium]|nr:hypothetical protein [Candidatus Dormibacteraeota bacterium]